MRTLHGLLDINKDGVISYDDFMLLAEKFGALGHLKPEALIEFREVMKVSLSGALTEENCNKIPISPLHRQHGRNNGGK